MARARGTTAMAAPAVHRPRAPLRVLGTSVTQTGALQRAAEEDLGIKLQFITRDGTEAQRQGALNPGSFDVYDQWFHDIDLIWPTGSIRSIDIARIDRWDEINALPKTGRLRPDLPRPAGGDPSKRLFVQLDGTLGDTPSERISMLPTVHNADSFAVVGVEAESVTSWAALLDPQWQGRVVLQADAAIGALDMALGLMAQGDLSASHLGDLTLEDIDALTTLLQKRVEEGFFDCIWFDEAEAVSAFQKEGPRIGSMWWSGFCRLRSEGTAAAMVTPKEGYRGWFGGLALSSVMEAHATDTAYAYLNWWLDGRPGAMMARSGAYMANPEAVRPHLSEDEWDFWYDGKPARGAIQDAEGRVVFQAGERREGGDYLSRMSRVRVWDAVMNEHNYLVRKWENAIAPMKRRLRAYAAAGSAAGPDAERRRLL
ncbi:PotD/PotF family extracellular solute-binding protein [Marimonas sp. MJW-29]|uniref:PotD/PotF family extracellular solute-binding protein n=1 Tax=Sulfitobacter sediminis TaxID=3234186 RepID=A0ABV3RQU1_9RHOB